MNDALAAVTFGPQRCNAFQNYQTQSAYVGYNLACSNHGSTVSAQFCSSPLQYQHFTRFPWP